MSVDRERIEADAQQYRLGYVGRVLCSHIDELLAALAAAEAENERLLDLLREIEWSGPDAEGDPRCHFCRNWKDEGHAPDCRLAAVLASRPGEGAAL